MKKMVYLLVFMMAFVLVPKNAQAETIPGPCGYTFEMSADGSQGWLVDANGMTAAYFYIQQGGAGFNFYVDGVYGSGSKHSKGMRGGKSDGAFLNPNGELYDIIVRHHSSSGGLTVHMTFYNEILCDQMMYIPKTWNVNKGNGYDMVPEW